HEVFADDLEPVHLRPGLEDGAVMRDAQTHADAEIGEAQARRTRRLHGLHLLSRNGGADKKIEPPILATFSRKRLQQRAFDERSAVAQQSVRVLQPPSFLQVFLPLQSFFSVLQPPFSLQLFLPLQQSLAAGAASPEAAGAASAGFCSPPPQPTRPATRPPT